MSGKAWINGLIGAALLWASVAFILWMIWH
jgi:hypothetical protein